MAGTDSAGTTGRPDNDAQTFARLSRQLKQCLAESGPDILVSADEALPSSRLVSSAAGLGADKRPVASPLPVQMLFSPLPWDWPVPSSGTTPSQAYKFFELNPGQPGGIAIIRPDRQELQQKLPGLSEVDRRRQLPRSGGVAQRAGRQSPPFQAPNAPLPLGWTRVTDVTGTQVSEPGWTVPYYPTEWINRVENRPLTLDLSGSDVWLSNRTQGQLVDPKAVTKLGFSARAWGSLAVAPAQWFDSSIVDTVRLSNGPFSNPQLDARKILGQDGLLPRRSRAIHCRARSGR